VEFAISDLARSNPSYRPRGAMGRVDTRGVLDYI